MKGQFQKYLQLYNARPKRERLLVGGAVLVVFGWLLLEGGQSVVGSFGSSDAALDARVSEINSLERTVSDYIKLASRLASLERSYASSEMSVEQVYAEVENVVREALGNDGYELRPSGANVSISDTAEQQVYALKLRALSLKQLVDLLYKLEQGKAPLFLGRLEVNKGTQQGIFSANLELSSIRRKRNGP
jgi:hypothetical protein